MQTVVSLIHVYIPSWSFVPPTFIKTGCVVFGSCPSGTVVANCRRILSALRAACRKGAERNRCRCFGERGCSDGRSLWVRAAGKVRGWAESEERTSRREGEDAPVEEPLSASVYGQIRARALRMTDTLLPNGIKDGGGDYFRKVSRFTTP